MLYNSTSSARDLFGQMEEKNKGRPSQVIIFKLGLLRQADGKKLNEETGCVRGPADPTVLAFVLNRVVENSISVSTVSALESLRNGPENNERKTCRASQLEN